MKFRNFGTMLEVSRNMVMTVEAVKEWIDLNAELGYNLLLLYMEDLYEMDGHPYFGYARGRYSKEELKEMDAYANQKGITLMPCIQTLGHLEKIFRWPQYAKILDGGSTILAGDEETYALIDDMFRTMSECFTTKTIHVGMDEASMLGRGKYLDIHGPRDHMDIMLEHLERVSQIGEKYGYTMLIWSDTLYTLATGDQNYHSTTATVQQDVKDKLPKNMELVYWDYYTDQKERYTYITKNHQQISDRIWLAGGLYTFIGFAPSNRYGIDATKAALDSCEETGVEDFFLTLWTGDGAECHECSYFAVLPSLFYVSEWAKGNRDEEDIKKKFEKRFGISFDDFMLIDLLEVEAPGVISGYRDRNCTSKYVLYNDLFLGLMDTTIPETAGEDFARMAERLLPLCEHPKFGYLFNTLYRLCKVDAHKANLGQKIRKAYQSGDQEELKICAEKVRELIPMFSELYEALRYQWMKENKAFGFEVQDARFGGLRLRTEHCADVLEEYLAGKIDNIPELEENLLDIEGKGAIEEKKYLYYSNYKKIITTSAF